MGLEPVSGGAAHRPRLYIPGTGDYALSTSFKSISDLYDGSVYLVAKSPTVNNYRRVWEYLDYPVRFVNSLLYSLACSLLQLMSCTLVAYGISRFRFRGRNLILGMVIFTLVIPPQTVLLSLYFQFQYFSPLSIFSLGMSLQGANLIGTPWPLLILSATAVGFKNGLYIFMLRQHFKNVPKELEEAASIDGCGCFSDLFPGHPARGEAHAVLHSAVLLRLAVERLFLHHDPDPGYEDIHHRHLGRRAQHRPGRPGR